VNITTMAGKSCTGRADEEELSRFAALVENARPDRWASSYVPENPCCDRIEYTMTVERGGATRMVKWVDDPAPMPTDLQAIVDAMVGAASSIRVRHGGKCE
jgi:hypothetical protein